MSSKRTSGANKIKKIDNNILESMACAVCNAIKCNEISHIVKKSCFKVQFYEHDEM